MTEDDCTRANLYIFNHIYSNLPYQPTPATPKHWWLAHPRTIQRAWNYCLRRPQPVIVQSGRGQYKVTKGRSDDVGVAIFNWCGEILLQYLSFITLTLGFIWSFLLDFGSFQISSQISFCEHIWKNVAPTIIGKCVHDLLDTFQQSPYKAPFSRSRDQIWFSC